MSTAKVDGWSPESYARFASHREAPFEALLELLSPCPGGAVLDLGCGTGALTARAHARLGAARTLGLDSSAAMLAAGDGVPGVTLERRELPAGLPRGERFERVLSNSAFNWLADHRALVPQVVGLVAPGGELAIQMPSNPGTPFSDAALEAAARFASELDGWVYRSPVEAPEVYAELLARDARVARSRVGGLVLPPAARVGRRAGRLRAGRAALRLPRAAGARGLRALHRRVPRGAAAPARRRAGLLRLSPALPLREAHGAGLTRDSGK